MIKKSELWERIRAARRRAGLRQIDVADRFEIDRTAVTQWESKDEGRRTRPDVAKLEEFAHLTRTPLWWLLSDDSDLSEAWPEVENEREERQDRRGASLSKHLQDFWNAATLRVREARQDLWDEQTWAPRGPNWMTPLVPDAMTKRALIQFVSSPRPDMARIASLAASFFAFERLQSKEYERKVIFVWRPPEGSWPPAYGHYMKDLDRISESAHTLCERLQVKYLEVRSVEEAAAYLIQLL